MARKHTDMDSIDRWLAALTAGLLLLSTASVGVSASVSTPASVSSQATIIDVTGMDAPSEVGPDEHFDVAVTLENPTDQVQEGQLRITIEDELFVRDVELQPGETRTVTQSIWSAQLSEGDHSLRAKIGGSAYSKTVTVGQGDEFERLPPTIRTIEAPAGQETDLAVRVPMEAERIGIVANHSPALGVTVDSVTDGEITMEMTPDVGTILAVENTQEPTLHMTVSPSEELVGSQELLTVTSVDDQDRKHVALISVDVVEGGENEDPIQEYRNEDGDVTLEGLTQAVKDWSNDEIDGATLAMVVDAWAAS